MLARHNPSLAFGMRKNQTMERDGTVEGRNVLDILARDDVILEHRMSYYLSKHKYQPPTFITLLVSGPRPE